MNSIGNQYHHHMDMLGKLVQGSCAADGTVATRNPVSQALDGILRAGPLGRASLMPPPDAVAQGHFVEQGLRHAMEEGHMQEQHFRQAEIYVHNNNDTLKSNMHHGRPPPNPMQMERLWAQQQQQQHQQHQVHRTMPVQMQHDTMDHQQQMESAFHEARGAMREADTHIYRQLHFEPQQRQGQFPRAYPMMPVPMTPPPAYMVNTHMITKRYTKRNMIYIYIYDAFFIEYESSSHDAIHAHP